tara:strand:+ start:127 stop:387 length:261 start_codon:yes stop_codon:yes gene_type:complete
MITEGKKLKEGSSIKIEGSLKKLSLAELKKKKKALDASIESNKGFPDDVGSIENGKKRQRMINAEIKRRSKSKGAKASIATRKTVE